MGREPPDRPELAVVADSLEGSLRQGTPPTPLLKGPFPRRASFSTSSSGS